LIFSVPRPLLFPKQSHNALHVVYVAIRDNPKGTTNHCSVEFIDYISDETASNELASNAVVLLANTIVSHPILFESQVSETLMSGVLFPLRERLMLSSLVPTAGARLSLFIHELCAEPSRQAAEMKPVLARHLCKSGSLSDCLKAYCAVHLVLLFVEISGDFFNFYASAKKLKVGSYSPLSS